MPDKYPDLAHITGTVGRDPEVRDTSRGPIVKFSVAETLGYGGQDGNDKTRWVNVAVFKEDLHPAVLAEVYKGAKVTCEGSLKQGEYGGKPQWEMVAFRVGLVTWLQRGQSRRDDDDI